jgi:hypothetical protein
MQFTYSYPRTEDLQQGGVLRKSEEIREILQEVHPHYVKEDYTHFIVLTQACDLVRRDDGLRSRRCTARYITMAAVRPLEIALKRQMEKFQNDLAMEAGVCHMSARPALRRFAEHLLDNNETELFYLHQEAASGLAESSCAFLRLAISIRAYEHYEPCIRARILSLDPMFQAKLGWMTGTMYSRIGTEDWVPAHHTKAEFSATVESILDQSCQWVDERKIKEAAKQIDPILRGRGAEAIRAFIESREVKNRKQEAIDRILDLLRDLGAVSPEGEAKVKKVLDNDPTLAALLPKYGRTYPVEHQVLRKRPPTRNHGWSAASAAQSSPPRAASVRLGALQPRRRGVDSRCAGSLPRARARPRECLLLLRPTVR